MAKWSEWLLRLPWEELGARVCPQPLPYLRHLLGTRKTDHRMSVRLRGMVTTVSVMWAGLRFDIWYLAASGY